jgi:cytidylate kinase
VIDTITVEREYGSGAAAIGERLAADLGWKLWDSEITCEIARRLNCEKNAVAQREEREDPLYYRLIKVFMRGSYEASVGSTKLELLDAETLARLFEDVVTDAADAGNCVITGRAAPWFLRNRPNVFRVFIYSTYDDKLRRTIAQGKSQKEAEHLLQTVDGERAAFVRKYHNKDWPDRSIYHLMINSSGGDDSVIQMVRAGMALLEK